MLFPAFVKWLGHLRLDNFFLKYPGYYRRESCDIFTPKTWLFHDAGLLGSDGSVENKMAVAIYEGI